MTKRAQGKYERNERDFYVTPTEPIRKLLPHLDNVEVFAEPMCGDGAIIRELESLGWICGWASDLEPKGVMVNRALTLDVLKTDLTHYKRVDVIISNPPWPLPPNKLGGQEPGSPTIQIIRHLMQFKPTWLLMAADFMHNRYFESVHDHCTDIVSVGRVSWQHNNKKGFDNAAWYRFDPDGKFLTVFSPNRDPIRKFHPSIEGLL